MAKNSSFDVSTGVDLQEVDNAVNQAHKEVAQRYDFKGTNCTMVFDRASASVALEADDTYRLQALAQVLREKLARRKVPLKNLAESQVEEGSLGRARQTIGFKQGIDQETGKKISKEILARAQVALERRNHHRFCGVSAFRGPVSGGL